MPAILVEIEAVKFAFVVHAGRYHEAVALVLFASSTTIPLVSITIQIIYSILVSSPLSDIFSVCLVHLLRHGSYIQLPLL